MAILRRRSPSSVLVGKGSISNAGSLLAQLPDKPKETWSLREAIHLLQEDITLALNKGYSHEEVAQILSDKGIKISPSSLKSYLAASRKTLKESGGKQRRTRKGAAPDAEESTEAAPEGGEAPPEKKRRGRSMPSKSAAAAAPKAPSKRAAAAKAPAKATRGRAKKEA